MRGRPTTPEPAEIDPSKPVEIDHVIVLCHGCSGKREHYPDRPIRGMEEIKLFLGSISPCGCGATHCDVKLRLKEIKVQFLKEPSE